MLDILSEAKHYYDVLLRNFTSLIYGGKRERGNIPKAEKCWPDTHVQLSNNVLDRVFLVGKLWPLLPRWGAGRARS